MAIIGRDKKTTLEGISSKKGEPHGSGGALRVFRRGTQPEWYY